jgi:hypothetical protein
LQLFNVCLSQIKKGLNFKFLCKICENKIFYRRPDHRLLTVGNLKETRNIAELELSTIEGKNGTNIHSDDTGLDVEFIL